MYRYGTMDFGSFARDFGWYHFKYSCSTLQKCGARDAGVLQNLGGGSLARRATPRGGPRSLSSAAVLAALGNFGWPDVVMWDGSEW